MQFAVSGGLQHLGQCVDCGLWEVQRDAVVGRNAWVAPKSLERIACLVAFLLGDGAHQKGVAPKRNIRISQTPLKSTATFTPVTSSLRTTRELARNRDRSEVDRALLRAVQVARPPDASE